MKRKRRYWYWQWCNECPVCGSQDKGKERRYTRKPKDPAKRYEFTMDGCSGGGCFHWL